MKKWHTSNAIGCTHEFRMSVGTEVEAESRVLTLGGTHTPHTHSIWYTHSMECAHSPHTHSLSLYIYIYMYIYMYIERERERERERDPNYCKIDRHCVTHRVWHHTIHTVHTLSVYILWDNRDPIYYAIERLYVAHKLWHYTKDSWNTLSIYLSCNNRDPTYCKVRILCVAHGVSQYTIDERWWAGVKTQKNVQGEIGGWGRVPFNEPYAPSLSTIYDGA